MDLMVNPVITGFRQDVDGTIKELKLGEEKQDAWANIAEQGASAKLDNNKTATINVSTYTEPVEVLPTSGKDGMKKATITLSNIPSGADLEDNKAYTINVSNYSAPVVVNPTTGKDGMKKATITLSNIPSPGGSSKLYAWYDPLQTITTYYTKTETPEVNDKGYSGDIALKNFMSSSGDTITAVNLSSNPKTITVGGRGYARTSNYDITI